jgi:broad specificity phosphatase PhoE/predicted GNAT family N-acyltransferase
MSRLLLIRHAQSQNNANHALLWKQFRHDREGYEAELERTLERDPGLSEAGRGQAEALALALAPALTDLGDRGLLVSSPMRRALQTAMPLAQLAGLDRARFVCQAELFEIGSKVYDPDTKPSELAARLEAEYPLRCCEVPSDALHPIHTQEESSVQTSARVDRVISWVEATLRSDAYDLILVIAHGNLMTRWLRRWMGVPWARGVAFVHANTGISLIEWDAHDGVVVHFINETSHLPEALQTGGGGNWWGYSLPDIQIDRYEARADIPTTLMAELTELQLQAPEPAYTLADDDAPSVHFVARVEGELAGQVRYEPESGRLRQLVVSPSRRHSQLGRRLVTQVEREALLAQRSELLVHVPLDSLKFFVALGFVACGEVQTDPGGAWQPMVKAQLEPW